MRTEADARAVLRDVLIKELHPDMDRSIRALPHADHPSVLLVVGVNGTGKTTTVGKLARVLVADGRRVVLGAADTFRAAAADQLQTWASRVGAEVVRGAEGADPASVAFDAVDKGIEAGADVVVIDTAGRLHTKVGLMDELDKVKRVVTRRAAVDEVLLVLDATIGQNGLAQARVFADVVDITGAVLTKLDGTAKGGIVFRVQQELGRAGEAGRARRRSRRSGAVRAGGFRRRPAWLAIAYTARATLIADETHWLHWRNIDCAWFWIRSSGTCLTGHSVGPTGGDSE